MPKSKRNKQIELAKTKKRGLEWKKHLLEEVRSCVDSYTNVFVFSVNDMRNSKMKNVRDQWKHSRFFIGKNKIMAMALGRSAEEEYKPNLHKIGQEIKGQRGLLFSNKSTEEVLSWFRSYSEGDYARSGNVSTEDVTLPAGPLPMFPHSLEPYLRQLGLPTSLVKGEIHLVKEHEVCKAGDTLTPESAKILKLLGYEMAEFHITIDCMWSHDGSFMKFTDNIDSDSKENIKKEKKKSIDKKTAPIVECLDEDMDVELIKNSDDLKKDSVEAKSPLTSVSNSPIAVTSTPKANSENFENGDEVHEIEVLTIAENEDTEVVQEGVTIAENEDTEVVQEGVNIAENEDTEVVKEDKSKVDNKRPGSKRTRKSKIMKRDSLPKTPDPNTSQDSPVFRQLRNRSVKVSRKRK